MTKPNLAELKERAPKLFIKGKGSPYSIAQCRVLELIPVLGSQPAGDMSHKPSGRLPLLSTRPAVTLTTLTIDVNSLPTAYPTALQLQFESRPFCA